MLEKEETWQKYINNWFLMPSHLFTQLIQGQGAEQGDGINRNCLSPLRSSYPTRNSTNYGLVCLMLVLAMPC